MNVRVEAGPISVSISASITSVTVFTQFNVVNDLPLVSQNWTCFSSYQTSLNGHSMNSINPDFKVGEVTTSVLA